MPDLDLVFILQRQGFPEALKAIALRVHQGNASAGGWTLG
jgi:hypothetical protein